MLCTFVELDYRALLPKSTFNVGSAFLLTFGTSVDFGDAASEKRLFW